MGEGGERKGTNAPYPSRWGEGGGLDRQSVAGFVVEAKKPTTRPLLPEKSFYRVWSLIADNKASEWTGAPTDKTDLPTAWRLNKQRKPSFVGVLIYRGQQRSWWRKDLE